MSGIAAMITGFDRRQEMIDFGRPYTMGFKDALMYGIDYRDYEKVSTLPTGVPLVAVAGVWGDYANIRCLFMTEDGRGYLRNISWRGGQYIIRELEVNAKEIEVGRIFTIIG